MELNTEKKMEDFIEKYKYVVIFPDKQPKLFKSLREIENEISVSASSISKKLAYNPSSMSLLLYAISSQIAAICDSKDPLSFRSSSK